MKPKRSEAGFVTLIELLVVTAIIVIVVYLLYGQRNVVGPGGVGPGGVGPGDEPQTRPGAAISQARALECQQNLRGIRQAIAAYRLESEQPPGSLSELRIGGVTSCPVSGNPYVYDPQTGTVRCTTPGHERF